MKKVLMVMGFALCASFAFAQTGRISIVDNVRKEKTSVTPAKAAVDYKASIFTKANGHDTIQVFKIDNASDYTIGAVAATDMIDDTVVGNANRHSASGEKNRWMRFSSISDFTNRAATAVPGAYHFMGDGAYLGYITEDIDPSVSPREPDDDGFMFLSYWENSSQFNVFNTYFTVPVVQRPANAQMIEVALTQCLYKYYDKSYIDYKVGGSWYSREINVTGIDADVNRWSPNKVRYVLPHRLNTEQNVEIRIRAWSNHRGAIYGYFWAVDNVAIMALTTNEYWTLNSPTRIDGFYGMIPQGMEIPLTWGVNAQNVSTSDITNAKATVSAGTDRTSISQVFQGPATTVVAGNLDTTYGVVINERGFYRLDRDADDGWQAWQNHSENFENTTGTLVGGYTGHGLPVTTSGKNFYNIKVSGGSSLSRAYDTILYYVTPMLTQEGLESGYRWAYDNGVIPSGASFEVAYTDPDPDNNNAVYITPNGSDDEEGGHVNEAGYAVHVRYVTGNDVPEGWVFRGLELIAATDRPSSDLEHASISAITYKEHYEETEDGTTLYYNALPCGIDNRQYEVVSGQINGDLWTEGGYILPSEGYNAINIIFPEQPALEANSAYRFGYRLQEYGTFALAGTRNSFRCKMQDTNAFVNVSLGYNGDNAYYAAAAANSRDYRYVQTPGTYLEVIAYDPIQGSSIYGWNIDNYPMIRPIVGPARPVEYGHVGAVCDDNVEGQGENVDHGVMVTRGNDSLCGNPINVAVGSSQAIIFEPMGDHSVIDRVLLNGRELTRYDDATGEGEYHAYAYNVYEDPEDESSDVVLQREYWVYYLDDIVADQNYTFTVYSHWAAHQTIGIDPVAPEAILSIAPNPATSMVKVNMKGVSGMVNCSILDMSGRVIYNADVNAESEHMINVSNIPAGAYFVRVTNNNFSKIEKLIIK